MPAGRDFVDVSLRGAMAGTWPGEKIPDGLRVDIGAGEVDPEDWVCIDQTASYPSTSPWEVVAAGKGRFRHDVCTGMPFLPTASVAALYAHHMIEHVPIMQWPALFDEIARVVRPGGFVYLCQPDLEAVCARTLEGCRPGGAKAWFDADKKHRTWDSDQQKRRVLDPAGMGVDSAWYWIYLGGDHRSVPSEAQIRSMLEPRGFDVRRYERDLQQINEPFRLAVSLEGCFVSRRKG